MTATSETAAEALARRMDEDPTQDAWIVAEEVGTISYSETDARYPDYPPAGIVFEDGSVAEHHPAHHQGPWIPERPGTY